MHTADGGPGNPSSPDEPWDGQQPQDLLPGQPHARELELDAYGVPVRERPAKGRAYLLVAAGGLICGGVSVWLAVMDIRAKLPLDLVILGFLLGSLSVVSFVLLRVGDEKRSKQHQRAILAMAGAGLILGFGGVILLIGAHCSGQCTGGG
jgi:hypothetical protein